MTSVIFGRQGVFSRSSGIASVKLPPGHSAGRWLIKTEKHSTNLYSVFIHGRVAGNVVEILLVEKLFAIDASHEKTTEHLEIELRPTVYVASYLSYTEELFSIFVSCCLKYRV